MLISTYRVARLYREAVALIEDSINHLILEKLDLEESPVSVQGLRAQCGEVWADVLITRPDGEARVFMIKVEAIDTLDVVANIEKVRRALPAELLEFLEEGG